MSITVKIWTNQTVHNRPQKQKKFNLPSKAVPDQSLSMHDLIERHKKGQILPDIAKTPLFTEDSPQLQTGINYKTLDLVEVQMLQVQNNTNIAQMEEAKRVYDAEKVAQKLLKKQEQKLEFKKLKLEKEKLGEQ